MGKYTIAACQAPAIFGDVERALGVMEEFSREAERSGASLVCFPECFLQGYTVGEASRGLAVDLSGAVFEPGSSFPVFEESGLSFGINICNDTNFPEIARGLAAQGVDLLVCPCNNMMAPANAEKWKSRHNEIRALRAAEGNLWLISSDVTGYDEKGYVSYGPTAVIDPAGMVVSQLPLMEAGLLVFEIDSG